ncbi:uncharacterized protein V3H86_015833 isoform 1-T1 [Mergus octosetaceus]
MFSCMKGVPSNYKSLLMPPAAVFMPFPSQNGARWRESEAVDPENSLLQGLESRESIREKQECLFLGLFCTLLFLSITATHHLFPQVLQRKAPRQCLPGMDSGQSWNKSQQ